ncbi:MAG: DUF1646 family protein [Candidatus Binataceae bacterium]
MTSLGAALILTLLLLGPLAVQALERNLEAYCLILGVIAVTLSGQWNRPLLAQIVSAPAPITLAVVVAGLAVSEFWRSGASSGLASGCRLVLRCWASALHCFLQCWPLEVRRGVELILSTEAKTLAY